MLVIQLLTNFFIYFIGTFGLVLNKRDIIKILICVELIFLSINLNFILFSVYFDDFLGQIISLFILTLAASESAIGLAIIILYYRLRGNININNVITIKG